MSNLKINTIVFAAYQFDTGDWVEWTWDGASVYGKVTDRTKDSFTVDGNTITGDDGENVYKMGEYDTEAEEMTGQKVAKPESSLSAWGNAPDMAESMTPKEIESEVLEMSFDETSEVDEVYSKWDDAVNMTDSEMTRWSDHPCADTASRDPEAVRSRNKMLLGTPKSEWDSEHVKAAKRTISFISRMRGQRPDNPAEGGKGTCPSEWAVSLLNWAYNPFDGMPEGTPEPNKENATDEDVMTFSASTTTPRRPDLKQEFNEYGIRENYDDDGELKSVDAVYEAMEPGPPERRKGVRITESFLKNVAAKDYDNNPPYLMDHETDTLSQIGRVKDVWYDESESKLMLMARTFNTGSQTHSEIINRLTFTPPTIKDGSIGFGDGLEMTENEDGETVLTDGRLREFSTTPFPAGYDDGGLAAT